MKGHYLLFPVMGMAISSCSMVNETMRSMECNRQAIDMSTAAICENIQAIEEANRSIEENRRQLEAINKTLKKESES
jgi:hypothetical protein